MSLTAVQNTQNKIYNNARRTYIDESDCKEGETICRKCKGQGNIMSPNGPWSDNCPQCLGHGIVDWVTQAVKRPIMIATDSSCSSSASLSSGMFKTYTPLIKEKPSGVLVSNIRNLLIKRVTNYKRRKIV